MTRRSRNGQPQLTQNRWGTWCIAWPRALARALAVPRLQSLGVDDRRAAERAFRAEVAAGYLAVGDARSATAVRSQVQAAPLDQAASDFLRDLAKGLAPPTPSEGTLKTQYVPGLLGRGGLLPFASRAGIVTTTQLSAPVVTRFLDGLRLAGRADDTLRLRLVVVRRFTRWSTHMGLISESVAAQVEAIRRPRGARGRAHVDGVPSLAEVAAFLGALSPSYWAPVAETQLRLGMRRGEVVNLQRSWIDPRGGVVCIPFARTKDREARVIHCDPLTLDLAREVVRLIETRGLTVSGYNGAWKRALARLAKRGIRWPYRAKTHALRQLYATESVAAGVPLAAVAERLGHSSVKVTERHYLARLGGRLTQGPFDNLPSLSSGTLSSSHDNPGIGKKDE